MILVTKNGFTLIETIIALLIFVVLASFSPLFIKVIRPPAEPAVRLEELQLFFTEIGKEIRSASSIRVANRQLLITNSDGETATYSQYGQIIRKQVKGLGHETWLQSIKRFEPSVTNGIEVHVNIQDISGKHYDRKFFIGHLLYEKILAES